MYVKVSLRESANVHFHFTCENSLTVPVSIYTEDKMSVSFKTKKTEEWTLLVGFICSSCHSQCFSVLLNEDFVFTRMNVELCFVYEWVKQEIPPLPPLVPGSVKSLTSDLYLPVAWWHVVLSPSANTQLIAQVIVLNRSDKMRNTYFKVNFSSIEIYDMASKKSTQLLLSMFWQTPTKLWHLKQQWKALTPWEQPACCRVSHTVTWLIQCHITSSLTALWVLGAEKR